MDVIYILIPLAIVIVALAIGIFFWAVKTEQFDDLERQGFSILFDEEKKTQASSSSSNKSSGEPSQSDD
ncbi:cbb3-type cytochrome oxidase assembly protein CcoS [Catenovulum sp. SM1970]|uniref:cbb3-type cytochrome oxidase assembly protein CcoS n=1 Tax=Marinifaba aquimaris TaxID=2741323 RepID=UPI001574BB1D|nr:cbb3-type cytochrome oxidase assembly protein CcoS [Marinifaba aquimaris]NTS77304.1 cbb3-type cytochrome oxidase assembly protein CcoS [Marinifaba aquimaris]